MTDMWETFRADVAEYLQYISAEEFEYAVNISLKYKYMYVETAKVGCSTIKLVLQRMELDEPEHISRDLVDMHSRLYSPMCSPARVGGFRRYMERNDIFRFCFVRNPYTRVLSCYLDKILNNMPAKSRILQTLGHDGSDLEQEISFSEFVNAISLQSIADMDPHWRVQYYQTFQEQIKYDYIGRFENLEKDLKHVLGIVSPDFMDYWGVENRHATHSDSQITDYYEKETESLVYDIYRKDFEAFSYARLKFD